MQAPDRRTLQRQGLKRLNTTLLPFAIGLTMAAFAAASGYAQWWQAQVLAGYTAIGLVAFYVLLRSNLVLRLRDPMMTFPQVLFSIGLVALSYALMDVARTVALQWLCLIMVFDMRRLPKHQTMFAAAMALILPLVGLSLMWHLAGEQTNLADELIMLAMGSLMVPTVLFASAATRKLHLRRQTNKTQMAQTLEQLRKLAVRDGLTGLYNRRHMQQLMDEEVRRQQRTGRPFCVAMVDIDFFKRVNDQRGHAMGDTVLRHFAALAQAAFQDTTDAVARWGGEEFCVLMPETTQAQAHAALLRMRALVHAYDWTQHEAGLAVTFSAGVCEHLPTQSLAQTTDNADQALYRAKAGGRDRIEVTTPQSDAEPQAHAIAAADVLPLLASVAQFVATTSEPPSPGAKAGSTPAAHPSRSASARRPSGLVRLMLGSDSTLHGMLSMCLVTMALYLCVMVSFFYSVPAGLVPLSAVLWLAPGLVLGATVPYLLVRNRVTARWQDPSLIVPQMLWATFLLTVGFVLIPKCREFPLQEMCVVMVFGFIDLRPRQAMTVGVATTLMLTLAYGAMLYVMPADFEPVGVGMQVISTAYIMMLLTLQSRNFANIREASKQEKRELTAATEQVRQMMTHDALTGLYNRQHMQGLLERECERHLRSGQTFCVALIDLDHFKQINDQHGHQVGDEALIGFAKAAQSILRGTDSICRWGGEEFLVLYTETSPEWHGFKAADRLREHVAAQRLCPSASHLQVTFSAGVAERRPEEPLAQLLERADQSLYAAKAQGRNRCVVDRP